MRKEIIIYFHPTSIRSLRFPRGKHFPQLLQNTDDFNEANRDFLRILTRDRYRVTGR